MTQAPPLMDPEVKDAITTINSLQGQDRKNAIEMLGHPDKPTTDWIWMIIVVTFALILLGAFVALAMAVFAYGKLSGDLLLTVFTTASAFLIGLLAPSPSQAKSS
jgi:heme A synthase